MLDLAKRSRDKVAHVFARQGIGMVWDFAEANIVSLLQRSNWMGQS